MLRKYWDFIVGLSFPRGTSQNVLAVFRDAVFYPVLDILRVVGISCVVRSDWHDPCGQQVDVPVERVVIAVTDHPDRLCDGEHVTRDAHRRSSVTCLLSVNSPAIEILNPVETIVQPYRSSTL